MDHEAVQRFLDQIEIIRNPSDLDLLLFFVRHRRTLLTSDYLAALLGYDAKQVGLSLEVLLAAGLLKRTQNPALTSRLYVLTSGGSGGGWLPELLRFASTRAGRLALIEALPERSSGGESEGRVSKRDRIALVR